MNAKHTATERRCLAAALRYAHGRGYDSRRDSLPRGRVGSSTSCPLARALGGDVAVSSCAIVSFDSGRTQFDDLPPDVARFVDMFDRRRFPELIQREED